MYYSQIITTKTKTVCGVTESLLGLNLLAYMPKICSFNLLNNVSALKVHLATFLSCLFFHFVCD